jgi:hypothetical protein
MAVDHKKTAKKCLSSHVLDRDFRLIIHTS